MGWETFGGGGGQGVLGSGEEVKIMNILVSNKILLLFSINLRTTNISLFSNFKNEENFLLK